MQHNPFVSVNIAPDQGTKGGVMNWSKVLIAGIVGGIAANIADFVMHGLIMGKTYMKYTDVFSQEQANPFYFLAISLLMAFFMAAIFAKTRGSWAAGWVGGATFGFWIGLFMFFSNFIPALVVDGFPYFLSWCWGGMGLIAATVMGAAIGAVYKG